MKSPVLYHISHRKNRSSILKKGLIPNVKNGPLIKYGPRVYFFSNAKHPPFHVTGWNNMDIWAVSGVANVKKDEFADPGHKWKYTTDKVHPSKLKLLKSVASQEEAMDMFFGK